MGHSCGINNHLWHKPTVLAAWDGAIIHLNPLPHRFAGFTFGTQLPWCLDGRGACHFCGWMDCLAFGALENAWIFICGWIFYYAFSGAIFSGILQGFFSGRFAANRFLFGRFSQDLSISFWKRHKFQSQPTRANVELPTAKSMRMNLDVDYRAQKNVTHNILVCWVYNIYICRFIIYIYIYTDLD